MLEDDAAHRVELRVIAPFARLLRRGYVELLLRVGPRQFVKRSPLHPTDEAHRRARRRPLSVRVLL